jgi:hypothetical protein
MVITMESELIQGDSQVDRLLPSYAMLAFDMLLEVVLSGPPFACELAAWRYTEVPLRTIASCS